MKISRRESSPVISACISGAGSRLSTSMDDVEVKATHHIKKQDAW